jgi:hypothetical protein
MMDTPTKGISEYRRIEKDSMKMPPVIYFIVSNFHKKQHQVGKGTLLKRIEQTWQVKLHRSPLSPDLIQMIIFVA